MEYIYMSDLDLNNFECLHCSVYTFYLKGNRSVSVGLDLNDGRGFVRAAGCREDMLFPVIMEKAECSALYHAVMRREAANNMMQEA